MRVSIIIPSFVRAPLLQWNLFSLAKQTIPFEFETIVLNDGVPDNTEHLCAMYKDKLRIRCIFTGQRNMFGKLIWRIPGYAINIGVKQSTGDIIVLCCAEMFHVNDTIRLLISAYESDHSEKILAIPKGKDDNSRFLHHLEISSGNFNMAEFENQPKLDNVRFPFLLTVKRGEFLKIGGYDEDFIGTDFDDTDFVERLVADGCDYVETEAKTVHLWHPRLPMSAERIPRYQYNKKLYEERKNVIVRNVGKKWGIL